MAGAGAVGHARLPAVNRTFVPALALSQPLDEAELDELERFLVSDQTSDETLTLSMLDGYLTALVIGPVTIVPSRWFPRVWGSRDDHAPVWDSMQQMERIMSLLLRHMNGIVAEFDAEPESFEPLFDAFEYRKRKYACGEGWAMGFMRGVELARADWQALFDDPKMAEALAPLLLLGADEPLSDAEERIVRTPLQRERLARKIPASLAAIHAFWMPYRITRATTEAPPTTLLRAGPKVGRNEPCPCGSGAKFKKCCGEGAT